MVKLNSQYINPKEIKYFFIKALTLHLNKELITHSKSKSLIVSKHKHTMPRTLENSILFVPILIFFLINSGKLGLNMKTSD